MTDAAAPTLPLIDLAADIVSAYVANNTVAASDLPRLIVAVHGALADAGAPGIAEPGPVHEPAVSVRKSLANRDRILSMIDGKPYASLTRHLKAHGLTPAEYRARYDLPAAYPMVAPGYAEKRSALAMSTGLGRKPAASAKKRGRTTKATV